MDPREEKDVHSIHAENILDTFQSLFKKKSVYTCFIPAPAVYNLIWLNTFYVWINIHTHCLVSNRRATYHLNPFLVSKVRKNNIWFHFLNRSVPRCIILRLCCLNMLSRKWTCPFMLPTCFEDIPGNKKCSAASNIMSRAIKNGSRRGELSKVMVTISK